MTDVQYDTALFCLQLITFTANSKDAATEDRLTRQAAIGPLSVHINIKYIYASKTFVKDPLTNVRRIHKLT